MLLYGWFSAPLMAFVCQNKRFTYLPTTYITPNLNSQHQIAAHLQAQSAQSACSTEYENSTHSVGY